MQSLPTGTVTFLFTDIEGSTQRWERSRAAMEDAVRRHDALVRAALGEHGGHVFKTVGDAFCSAFAKPEDAVAAVLAAQRALRGEDFSAVDGLPVRVAIHTGTADERDGDYFGTAVNRVARLLAIAHGGQTLISGATAQIVQGDLPPQASLRDLGEHQLKDLARPEHVYQLVAPGLETEFPPLRSLDVLPNNLPRMLTSFIGRENEVAELTALIANHQLVTLVGSGGVGKTRTSLQVAANLLDGSGDGVWFVELAPLAGGEYIPSTVAKAMGLTLATEGAPLENLVRALKTKRALLVFDNCEHLIEPAAQAVAAIVSGCPHINILASGRQALEIAGEETYRLSVLDVPKEGANESLRANDAMQSAAIALFVDRARTVDKRFALTDENAATIADICRRLDGIPLAIELAASRVQMLSPRQLRDRLDERFRVLTSGSRNVLPRQQTLRALIDWSHDLLDERERTLFRRLSVFVNSFTLEGAVALGSGEDLDEIGVFDVLASLVGKSLVLAEPDGDALRYRYLESTRVYALEKLDAAGERAELAARHLGYLRDRFADLRAMVEETARDTELDEALTKQLDDVRVALDAGVARKDARTGAELLSAIGGNWRFIGLGNEGIARCEAYRVELPETELLLHARLTSALPLMYLGAGRKTRALEVGKEAVERARASGSGAVLAVALDDLAYAAHLTGDLDVAERALDEHASIPFSSASMRLNSLWTHAAFNMARGNLDAAVRMYEQLVREYRALGNGAQASIVAGNLAEVEHTRGQTARAIEIAREIMPEANVQARRVFIQNLLNLAGYLVALDDLDGAEDVARKAIAMYVAEPDHAHSGIAVEHLALVCALRGDVARAAVLEGYAAQTFERHGFNREFTETKTYERLVATLRERLPAADLERLTAEGAALSPEAAISFALENVSAAAG